MLKRLDIYKFFDKETEYKGDINGIGGIGIITPSQFIEVVNLPGEVNGSIVEGAGLHYDTIDSVLKDILGVDELDNIPNAEYRFIVIRYSKGLGYEEGELLKSVDITIPMYVNNYQFEELIKLDKKYKELNLNVDVAVDNYNPIDDILEEKMPVYFDRDEDNQLSSAIDFLRQNKRIEEYVYPFEENKYVYKLSKKM